MSLSRNEFLEEKVKVIISESTDLAELWTGTVMGETIVASRDRLIEAAKTHNRTIIYPILGKLRKQLAEARYEMR